MLHFMLKVETSLKCDAISRGGKGCGKFSEKQFPCSVNFSQFNDESDQKDMSSLLKVNICFLPNINKKEIVPALHHNELLLVIHLS